MVFLKMALVACIYKHVYDLLFAKNKKDSERNQVFYILSNDLRSK